MPDALDRALKMVDNWRYIATQLRREETWSNLQDRRVLLAKATELEACALDLESSVIPRVRASQAEQERLRAALDEASRIGEADAEPLYDEQAEADFFDDFFNEPLKKELAAWGLDRTGLRSWYDYMDQFKREVFPLISEHGLSLGEAMMLFEMSKIYNVLLHVRDLLEDAE